MNYSTYGYHGSKRMTTPRSSCANIKGVELEISDYDCGYILDDMIEQNILTVPYNEEEEKEFIITVEEDGSVYKELVFKACCNQTLLQAVKEVERYLGNGRIENGPGTSCHIHINNRYLESLGLRKIDIVKASEFLAPVLFRISGRTLESLHWAHSILENKISIENVDLYERINLIDRIRHTGARYNIVNINPSNSTEIRIFSNRYGFDYDYIKMYIETVDFIIELAEYMHGKRYAEEYDSIIRMSENFFRKRKYKNIYEKHDLFEFFVGREERMILNLRKELRYLREEFNRLNANLTEDNSENAIKLLRVLRNYSNRYYLSRMKFNIYNFDINEIQNELITNIERKLAELEENQ